MPDATSFFRTAGSSRMLCGTANAAANRASMASAPTVNAPAVADIAVSAGGTPPFRNQKRCHTVKANSTWVPSPKTIPAVRRIRASLRKNLCVPACESPRAASAAYGRRATRQPYCMAPER